MKKMIYNFVTNQINNNAHSENARKLVHKNINIA